MDDRATAPAPVAYPDPFIPGSVVRYELDHPAELLSLDRLRDEHLHWVAWLQDHRYIGAGPAPGAAFVWAGRVLGAGGFLFSLTSLFGFLPGSTPGMIGDYSTIGGAAAAVLGLVLQTIGDSRSDQAGVAIALVRERLALLHRRIVSLRFGAS